MEEVMQYLHNYFYRFKEKGKFTINFNTITINGENLKGPYVHGQYVRIIGSSVNDGIYKVASCGVNGDMVGITLEGCLSDETFEGYICGLAVPKSFITLCEQINKYEIDNPPNEMVSESFGGYSYTRAQSAPGSTLSGWQLAFKGQLAPYRRISDGFAFVKEVK